MTPWAPGTRGASLVKQAIATPASCPGSGTRSTSRITRLRTSSRRAATRTNFVPQAASALLSLVPPCVLDTTAGDPIVYSNYSRTDMPPFKGGKYEEVREAGVTYFCTTGFMYALNGYGQQPIRVSTAGHRTQESRPFMIISTMTSVLP